MLLLECKTVIRLHRYVQISPVIIISSHGRATKPKCGREHDDDSGDGRDRLYRQRDG